jgi:hypothetical protein
MPYQHVYRSTMPCCHPKRSVSHPPSLARLSVLTSVRGKMTPAARTDTTGFQNERARLTITTQQLHSNPYLPSAVARWSPHHSRNSRIGGRLQLFATWAAGRLKSSPPTGIDLATDAGNILRLNRAPGRSQTAKKTGSHSDQISPAFIGPCRTHRSRPL